MPAEWRTYDLRTFGLSDMTACGGDLRAAVAPASSFDEAADRAVRFLHERLVGPDGEPACALVRCFHTRFLGDLPSEEQTFAAAQVDPGLELSPQTICLRLVATAGDEPDWNDRERSAGHRALPLPSSQVVERSPMIAGLIRQFGLALSDVVEPDPQLILDHDHGAFNVFHVEQAHGSTYVPAQAGFVEPYGIRSVLGFGAMFPTGQLFAIILFSRVSISREVAERFETIALNVKVALLPFLPQLDPEDAERLLQVRAAAFEELVEVQEQVVAEQGTALEASGRRLRRLADAAVRVNEGTGIEDILDRITREAADLVGARQAVTSLTVGASWEQAITSVWLDDAYAAWRDYDAVPDGSGIYALVCREQVPMRLTQAELEAHPSWRAFGDAAPEHPPMRGWLAAPLTARDGTNLGLIQLSDRIGGEFSAEDEAILVQLAQVASLAVENARMAESQARREAARFRQELLAGITHDMKTPLAAVVGLAESLADEVGLPPEERTQAQRALVRQARALKALVMQFLDYARLEAGRDIELTLQPVALAESVESVVRLFLHLRSFDVDVPADLPPVLADGARLEQVVGNLVSNAVKFSSPDSRIGIVARPRGAQVELTVEDEGTGLEPTEVLNLFQKFYRGGNTQRLPGSGLGLYITKLLVDAMEGDIHVQSEPGKGSRFTIRLPVVGGGDGREVVGERREERV